jgi:hypothetical protein
LEIARIPYVTRNAAYRKQIAEIHHVHCIAQAMWTTVDKLVHMESAYLGVMQENVKQNAIAVSASTKENHGRIPNMNVTEWMYKPCNASRKAVAGQTVRLPVQMEFLAS